MAKTDVPEEPKDEPISPADLKRFGEVLGAMGQTYVQMADWLSRHEVPSLTLGGYPTARRGAGYLAGFIGTVLKAYLETAAGESGPSDVVGNALKVKKRAGELTKKPKPINPEEDDLLDQATATARAPKAKR